MTAKGWKNKRGTGNRSCGCGSWKKHWINCSGKPWPRECSVLGCDHPATLGAHIINSNESGEYIVPTCAECNAMNLEFDLKGGITLVSANKQKTCDD